MDLALCRPAMAGERKTCISRAGEQPVNIGFFSDSYRPYTSGVVRSIDLFTREFNARGHEVYIFGPDYPLIHYPREEKVFRFASIPAPTMPEFSIPIPFSVQLGTTIRRLNLQIIHVHSPFLLGRLGARAARQSGLPLIFTFHTLYDQYVHYLPLAQQTTKSLVLTMARDFCNRCDLVIAPSSVIEQYLRGIGVKTEVVVIPTGIDLKEFADTDPRWLQQNYQVSPAEKVLLFVGRLGKEKNIMFLLKSFYRVQRLIPDLRLVIVGEGPHKEELRRFCFRLGIAGKVIFTGVLPRDQIVHCYAGADLFVFPSVTETQGLVIGEAKAAGLPVVAIRAFGAAEMVRDGEDGLLSEHSQEQFTGNIIRLLKDRSLYEVMRRNALRNAAALSSASSAEKMLSCYERLLELRRPSPTPSRL